MKLRLKGLICRHQSNDQNCPAVISCTVINCILICVLHVTVPRFYCRGSRLQRQGAVCNHTRLSGRNGERLSAGSKTRGQK